MVSQCDHNSPFPGASSSPGAGALSPGHRAHSIPQGRSHTQICLILHYLLLWLTPVLPSAATGLDPGGSHTQGSGWEGSITGDGRLGGWTDGVLKVYETRPGRVWELAPDSLGARVAWWWEMIHGILGLVGGDVPAVGDAAVPSLACRLAVNHLGQ